MKIVWASLGAALVSQQCRDNENNGMQQWDKLEVDEDSQLLQLLLKETLDLTKAQQAKVNQTMLLNNIN